MRAWLVLHVLAAIGGIGPEMAFGMMGPHARRRGRTSAVAVYEAVHVARLRVVYPLLALQILSGIALIRIGHHSLGREAWLTASLTLYGLAILTVVAVLVPASRRARAALAAGLEPSDPRLAGLWTRLAAAGAIAGSLLIAVAILMVWKPAF